MKNDFNLTAGLEAAAKAATDKIVLDDALLQALAASESRLRKHYIALGPSSAVGDISKTRAFADFAARLTAIPEVKKVTFWNSDDFIEPSKAYAIVHFKRQPSLARRIGRFLAMDEG